MIMETKQNIYQKHSFVCLKADKKGKGEILSHICFITGMHNNSAIRKFRVLQSAQLWAYGPAGQERIPHSGCYRDLKNNPGGGKRDMRISKEKLGSAVQTDI